MAYLALYGGPDQLMPITSGLTAIFAFLLVFWNKVLGVVGKIMNFFRGEHSASVVEERAPKAPELVEPGEGNAKQSQPEIR